MRKLPRLPVRLRAQALTNVGTFDVTVCNVSRGGALLLASAECAMPLVQSALTVRLNVGENTLELPALVVWVNEAAYDHRGQPALALGAQFTAPQTSPALQAIAHLLVEARPVIVTHGLPAGLVAPLQTLGALREATRIRDVFDIFAVVDVAVLVVGPDCAEPERLLTDLREQFPPAQTCNVVLTGGELERFQTFVDADALYYVAVGPIAPTDLVAIVQGGIARYFTRTGYETSQLPFARSSLAERTRQLLALSRKIAHQVDWNSAARLLAHAAHDLVDADRFCTLIYDPRDDVLWVQETGDAGAERRESAAAGLIGFVARASKPVMLEHVGSDGRYDAESDNPGGDFDDRFVAAPVSDASGRTYAVLLGYRNAARPAFARDDLDTLQLLARQAASTFAQIEWNAQVSHHEEHQRTGHLGEDPDLFRREALLHHAGSQGSLGEPLRVPPPWMRRTFWLFITLLVASAMAMVIFRIAEYATGPAIVRVHNKVSLVAQVPGSVREVYVKPNQRVYAGQVLVQLHDAEERSMQARVRGDFENTLLARLRSPGDNSVSASLSSIRAQLEETEHRLREKQIRAPQDGVIGDVRAQPGFALQVGDEILSMTAANYRYFLTALVPGRWRPKLRVGQTVLLTLSGYTDPVALRVSSVGDEIVGPLESRRYLGKEAADAVAIGESMVALEAEIATPTFVDDNETYGFHEGMVGLAEVRVGEERVIFALVPSLKELI